MDPKSILRAIALELRHELEGKYDIQGDWQPGDLERRLAAIGVRRRRSPVPLDELSYLSAVDREARRIVDAFLESRAEAGQDREAAITEFVREAAYSWANRLLALRCMEARGLIEEVILQKDVYGGRSLQHQRLARREPERCSGEDEGLFAVLFDEFGLRARELPLLFDPKAPEVSVRPSVAALKRCIALLSGTLSAKGQEAATDDVFTAADALGWTYQYWNKEEKERVFEKLRAKKGAKIEGAEIIPATCIYTEPYMVKFLVQNSLGAMWMAMNSSSRLCETWEYYIRDADRPSVSKKAASEIAFLDPACGSGHFLIEAFELYYAMYLEEGTITEPEKICTAIFERNLYGIDIDDRAVQIAALALVMKAKEKAPDFVPRQVNLVATNFRLPARGEHLDEFLSKHSEDAPLKPALLAIFEGLAHADELGSLLQIEEPVDRDLRRLRDQQIAQERKVVAGTLFGPRREDDWITWKHDVVERLGKHFSTNTHDTDLPTAFFGAAASRGLSLVDLLARRYDVVAANPPYLGKRKLGEIVRRYLATQYKPASEDLYAAFLQRALSLLCPGGRLAFVTMAGYAHLPPFTDLRKRMLQESSLEILAFLGSYAFPEMRDHVSALLTIASRAHDRNGRVCIVRAEEESDKPASLNINDLRLFVDRQLFGRLPNCTFAYWFDERLLADYSRHKRLAENALVSLGLSAIDNARFYRRSWEVSSSTTANSWFPLMKGGQYDRWAGPCHWAARWERNGTNWKLLFDKKYQYAAGNYDWKIHDPHTYFKRGVCYTNASSWGMGARELPAGALFEDTCPGLFSDLLPPEALACLLNSRAFHLYAALVNPSVHLQPGDVREIPVPIPTGERLRQLAKLGRLATATKESLLSRELTAAQFDSKTLVHSGCSCLEDAWRSSDSQLLRLEALLAWVDGLADYLATRTYLTDAGFEILTKLVTNPTSWQPLPTADVLVLLAETGSEIEQSQELVALADVTGFCRFCGTQTSLNRDALRSQFEEGDASATEPEIEGDEREDRVDPEADADVSTHSSLRMFDQTFVEQASRRLAINPLAAGVFVASGVANAGWRNTERLADYCSDVVSYYILDLLGHRWAFSKRSVGDCDRPGVLPLSQSFSSRALLSLVRERFAEDFGSDRVHAIEHEFQEIVGKSLGEWLSAEFFKSHISQFKKRPIAWQIGSTPTESRKRRGRRSARGAPAFSCLVYYHRMDADLLPKLRTQYVGPLRTSFQTELAGLEKAKDRTTDQDARRIELEEKLDPSSTVRFTK